MEPNAMITVGLVPSQKLVSLLTDDEGNWRDVPEGQTVVPLVKIPKPETGAWEPSVVWFNDRVERQWVAGTPAPAPTFTAEQWISQTLTPLQVIALQRYEMSLLTAGIPLGPLMSAMKAWLEGLLVSWSADPTPKADWAVCPTTYELATGEALLSLQNPET